LILQPGLIPPSARGCVATTQLGPDRVVTRRKSDRRPQGPRKSWYPRAGGVRRLTSVIGGARSAHGF